MKKAADDDYWPPRPGSWEEAVDPYDVQWARLANRDARQEARKTPGKVTSEQHPAYSMPTAV